MNLDLLRQLSEAAGPAGGEGPVREILRDHLRGRVDELYTDVLGNLFAVKRSVGPNPPAPFPTKEGGARDGEDGGESTRPRRVLVTAHMDEAGLMVVQIGGNGLLKVRAAGRIEARSLRGQVVHVGSGRVPGVIGVTPIHLTEPGQRSGIPDLDDLGVDIGVDSREAAQGAVQRGDYAVYSTQFGELGRFIKGKALDNRFGVAVVAALLDGAYPCDLHAVFTVQEGVGARGARVAAYAVQPDLAIIVDGINVDELPDEDERVPTPRLGAGPVLVLSDTGVFLDRALTKRLETTAQAEKIPYQLLAARGGSSDARAVQVTHTGVPTALVGLPLRYTHTPVTLASQADGEAAETLLGTVLRAG